MKRLQEIALRSQEIESELKAEDISEKRATELSAELDELIDERSRLVIKDKELRDKTAQLKFKPQDLEPTISEVEKRAREFKETNKATLELSASELRSTTIASGQLLTPTQIGGINPNFPNVSALVDLVNIVDMKGTGEYQVAYETNGATAGKVAEGGNYPDSTSTFSYCTIKPTKIAVYTEVSREVTKLTPLNYLERVKASVINAIRRKVSELIIKGDPTATPISEPTGILNASAVGTELVETAINENTLRNIVLNYGGDQNVYGAATLILNKADLIAFGKVRSTTDKRACYEITPDVNNPSTGVLREGGTSCRYIISEYISALSADTTAVDAVTMIYGNLSTYELALFSDYTIEVSTDFNFRNKMLAITADVLVGGNVTFKDGFIKIVKGQKA